MTSQLSKTFNSLKLINIQDIAEYLNVQQLWTGATQIRKLQLIGQGSYNKIYRAVDPESNRVIRVSSKILLTQETVNERLQEVELMTKIYKVDNTLVPKIFYYI